MRQSCIIRIEKKACRQSVFYLVKERKKNDISAENVRL